MIGHEKAIALFEVKGTYVREKERAAVLWMKPSLGAEEFGRDFDNNFVLVPSIYARVASISHILQLCNHLCISLSF